MKNGEDRPMRGSMRPDRSRWRRFVDRFDEWCCYGPWTRQVRREAAESRSRAS